MKIGISEEFIVHFNGAKMRFRTKPDSSKKCANFRVKTGFLKALKKVFCLEWLKNGINKALDVIKRSKLKTIF